MFKCHIFCSKINTWKIDKLSAIFFLAPEKRWKERRKKVEFIIIEFSLLHNNSQARSSAKLIFYDLLLTNSLPKHQIFSQLSASSSPAKTCWHNFERRYSGGQTFPPWLQIENCFSVCKGFFVLQLGASDQSWCENGFSYMSKRF